jgi:hypothetical protein
MTRVLRSSTKKIQSEEEKSSKLTIINKSKVIVRINKKVIVIKNETKQQNSIWNIESIMSNIFAYIEYKELVEFNTVCRKWNNLTNPIIHKTIKLDRRWDISWQNYYKKNNNAAKIDADVVECITNNAKHVNFVKEFRYSYELYPQRAIEVFETFRFIINLTIEHCHMSQDQFLGMVNPLTQLQELALNDISIKKIIRNRICKEAIQLPFTLKKLRLIGICLIDNPELFIQTINSHRNLIEFSQNSMMDKGFLEPFYRHYPSLLNFEFEEDVHESSQSLIKIFEHNSQLISLKLTMRNWKKELNRFISRYLNNLEELNISRSDGNYRTFPCFFLEFSHPTKIKKLSLRGGKYGNSLLNSIFLNCPRLEDLALNEFAYYNQPDSESLICLYKRANIKKLTIDCQNLKARVLGSILMNCPQLNELDISLPFEWKEAIKSIFETCSNLQKLEMSPPLAIYQQIRSAFSRELRLTEFFHSSPKFKSTLTHITLNHFITRGTNAMYYKNFEQLKSIKYPSQPYINRHKPDIKTKVNMENWPGYKLVIKDNKYNYDIEFKKILN